VALLTDPAYHAIVELFESNITAFAVR
jgi:hypothetical protein